MSLKQCNSLADSAIKQVRSVTHGLIWVDYGFDIDQSNYNIACIELIPNPDHAGIVTDSAELTAFTRTEQSTVPSLSELPVKNNLEITPLSGISTP